MSKSRGREGNAAVVVVVLIAVAVLAAYLIKNPDQVRVRPIQVPVGVSVRGSALGLGNVLQVRNSSHKALTGVQVSARNDAADTSISHVLGQLAPGETKELGWMEWGWVVEAEETVTVRADGHAPITFSSEQLGVR